MDSLIQFFLVAVLILVPVYVSNALALVFGGKTPIDFGRKFFDGKPLLGKGKTFKGTAAGIFFGSLAAFAVSFFFPGIAAAIPANYFHYGVLLAIGAMLGDIAGSFAKRRMNVKRGGSVALLDQLDFVAGAIIVGAVLFIPSIWHILLLIAITVVVHRLANIVAFKTRMKKVPW